MADGQQGQDGQQYNQNDYFLKQQAARMLNAIQKGSYFTSDNDNFQTQSMSNSQTGGQQVGASVYMTQQINQQQQVQQQVQQQQVQQQAQSSSSSHHAQVQQQQLQHQLQQVQQAQQQFQQMQQLAQMQQQFQQYPSGSSAVNVMSQQAFSPCRRGRKPTDKKKRKRHTWVKRPTTAYLYFVSKYRETLKEAGEVVPKAKIITQACAEKWRNMNVEEKEPFLELSRRDRERWQKDKALEKKPRDPNRPKRPPSAYFLFLAFFRKNYPGKADPAKEITKKAGEAWNNLTDQEKAPYYRDAQVVRAKWERDLEEYKRTTSCVALSQVNHGPLSRTSSMHSEHDELDLGPNDASPIGISPTSGNSLAQINPSMLTGDGSSLLGMGVGQSLNVDSNSQSPSSVNTGSSSIATSAMPYAYPQHMQVAQSAGLQFQGR